MKTLRVCSDNFRHVKQESLACGDARQSRKPLGSRMRMYARLASLPLASLGDFVRGRISAFEPRESTRQVEGLFESLLAEAF